MTVHNDLESVLSNERFNRYISWSGDDRQAALELYTLNTKISESLYTPLQSLEITLRNRIYTVMAEKFNPEWINDEKHLRLERQISQLENARTDLAEKRKEIAPGQLVATLSFSYWTSMFNAEYETLWQQGLHKIAKKPDGKGLRRKDFTRPMTKIRLIRNRIAHHEPILNWNLLKHNDNIIKITEWLSPDAAKWSVDNSRFIEVHPPERILLQDLKGVTSNS